MLTHALGQPLGFTGNHMPTILVVDDEAPIRMFVAEYLADYGLNVMEAASAAQAKDLLLDHTIDVVFSDINMPGGETGFGLARWIYQYCPNTKVLLTSGYPQVAADTRSLREPLILKPYSLSTVLGRIEKLFSEDSHHYITPRPR